MEGELGPWGGPWEDPRGSLRRLQRMQHEILLCCVPKEKRRPEGHLASQTQCPVCLGTRGGPGSWFHLHTFVSRSGGCSAARTSPKLACPEHTFPGPEYLPPPCLGQRGLSGPWAGAPHHPDPAGASPWSWSQFLAHQGTRGAFSTSILERLRFSHLSPQGPSQRLSLVWPGLT